MDELILLIENGQSKPVFALIKKIEKKTFITFEISGYPMSLNLLIKNDNFLGSPISFIFNLQEINTSRKITGIPGHLVGSCIKILIDHFSDLFA